MYVCLCVGGGGDEYCYENRDRIGGEGLFRDWALEYFRTENEGGKWAYF